ncbi:MAG: efflux RND transporter periplasmic adaptor subunit [Lachnospiraceae bacterium]|nr:efflux RND transporter periplasmic adaptor subunit [Lachnospiraceae bacterium]
MSDKKKQKNNKTGKENVVDILEETTVSENAEGTNMEVVETKEAQMEGAQQADGTLDGANAKGAEQENTQTKASEMESVELVTTTKSKDLPEKKKKEKKEKKKKEKKPLDRAAKKKRRRIILCSILGVVIVFFAVSKVFGSNGPQTFVMTTGAFTGEIEQTISTSGTVTTELTKSYFSDVDVKIGDVAVAAGDAVKAGDILISYDAEDLATKTTLAQLKIQSNQGNYNDSVQSNGQKWGDLNEANVNISVLDQQIADTEAYITNLENKIEQKKSDLAYEGALLQISLLDWQDHPDSDEYMNLQKLVQLNSYEQQNNEEVKGWEDELAVYNKMLSDYKEYRSEMKSQKSSAEAGRMTSGARQELEAENQTKGIEASNSLESLQAAANGVAAEFDGVVTEINAVEGGTVATGSQLLKLESTQDVMVRVTVTKYDLDKIAVGQNAIVTIGSQEYEGKVTKINKMAEQNNSGASVVGTEIKITNPDSEVILGVEAKVIISTAQEKDAVLIPVTAVNVDMEGEFVYVVEENILVKKRITTGISSDTMVQVTEGLSDGEQVVTDVTANLMEGMVVAAMPQ